jgi:hypothetical protein
VNDAGDAVLIMVLCTSASQDPQIFEKFGEWTFGAIKFTTQPQNKLGYRDRLVMADSRMAWAQLIDCDGGATINVTGGYDRAGLRYKCLEVTQLRSVATSYTEGVHFQINPAGGLDWITTPPDADTVLSVNYMINPVFEVFDHVYAFRNTLVSKKAQAADKAAQFKEMPIHAMGKLDYLVEGD